MHQLPVEYMLLISLLMGLLAAYVAKRKGKSPYGWFFCGFFFGLLGVICIYFFLGKKKEEKQVVATPAPIDPLANKIWYYLDQDMNQTGPMSYPVLRKAWNEGVINNETYIWNPDLEDWKQLEEILPKSTS